MIHSVSNPQIYVKYLSCAHWCDIDGEWVYGRLDSFL